MNKKYRGILCIILSAFFFSLMNICVRLSGDLPFIQKSFFRNFVAAIMAAILLIRNNEKFSLRKENLPYFMMRAVFGTVGVLGNFYAVDHLVISDASMLNKMSPFFAILFSYLFLKEKLKPYQIAAVITAFVGALFIIRPSFQNTEFLPAIIGFIGGMGAGAAYTAVRVLGLRGERGPMIVFFFSCFSCLVTIPYLFFSFHPMSLFQLGILLLAGTCAACGQFSITAAYCYAPAREISVYDYSQILFSAILGFFVFGQIPDILSWIGYFIICGTAVLMFLYTSKQEHQKS